MPGLLAFHAHPDDETTSTGGVLAKYSAAGEHVVVVTATDGAEGEIHNYDDPESLRGQLTEMREQELDAALRILNIEHHAFLGYRDSGMMGTDANADSRCFWQADFMEATGKLVSLIRHHQPEVLVVYDPFGGYGHPDHIQVHRVGVASYWGAGDVVRFPLADGEEPWQPAKLYWSAWPRSRMRAFADLRLAAELISEEDAERMRESGTPDEAITTWIDVREHLEQKNDAWKAHRTQIPEDWFFFQVPDDLRPDVFGDETFVRVFGPTDGHSRETDLFSGLR